MRVVRYLLASSPLAPITFVLACSGASATPIADPQPAPTTAAGPATPPPAAPPPAATPTGPAPPPPPPKDTRLFPADTGRGWSWTVTQTGMFGSTSTFTVTSTVTGKGTVDGHSAWIVETDSGTSEKAVTYADVQGDDELARDPNDTQWLPVTKSPVAEGKSWTYQNNGTFTQTWHSAGTTTVAAGTFDDCWRIDFTIAETSKPGDVRNAVYCRGVGLVKSDTTLASGYISRYELTAKTF
jgi:hypothetical protein